MIKLYKHFLLISFSLLLLGCNDTIVKTSTKEKNVKVSVILENSGSMAGFFTGNTEFVSNVTNLASSLDKIVLETQKSKIIDRVDSSKSGDTTFIDSVSLSLSPPQFFTVGSNSQNKPIASNASTFNSLLKTGIATESTSPLDKILQNAVDSTGDSNVTMLISDFIYDDKTGDCGSLLSGIQGRISPIFNALAQNPDFAIFIYRFESRFNGSYETCNNTSVTLNSTNRPYFVWMFGNRTALVKIHKRLEKESTFSPKNFFCLGLNKANMKFDFLRYSLKEGQWAYNNSDSTISSISSINDKPLKMTICLNLENFPDSLSNLDYLKKNLKVEGKGIKISSHRILHKDSIKTMIESKDDKIYGNCSVFLEITFAEPQVNSSEISVRLMNKQNRWFEDMSIDNDSNIQTIENKTFGIKQFINGVESAFNTQGNDNTLFHFIIKCEN